MSNTLVQLTTQSVGTRYTEDWDLLIGDQEFFTVEELAEVFPNILEEDYIPFLLDTDSYKLSHTAMYPDAKSMSAYFTFRGPLEYVDQRINFVGMRYLYEKVLSRKITWKDIAQADAYTAKHSAGGKQFDWPRDLWIKVVNELNGNLPLKVVALRDGETIYAQTPCFIVTAESPYERLVTWFETQMMRIWSPSVTATKSALIRTVLSRRFEQSVDEDEMWRLSYAMQDFGSRGTSSAETSMTAGMGYLSVFDGTDNIISAMLCTRYNGGTPVGQSVIASEHSVMTAWETEDEALERLIDLTPEGGILSCVADSYDYDNFLWKVLPRHVAAIRAKNIYFVARPDSGNPVICVLDGLRALDAAFGHRVNKKGFKVLNGAAIIQGDGIDPETLAQIAEAVSLANWSAQCVVYGMGGGLLQKQNRDSMRAAMKLCEVVWLDGTVKDCMKAPKTDSTKGSLAGMMQVNLVNGIPMVYPKVAHWEDYRSEVNLLEEIWNRGPTGYVFENWEQVRARHLRTWNALPQKFDPVSAQMNEKTAQVGIALRARMVK